VTVGTAAPASGFALPTAPSVSLLVASPRALSEAETRLILDTVARGEDVALVSGDNRLDAYGLLARARARGLEDAVADGVLLARAFTVHQLAALLEETLPRMAAERSAGLALVTGVLEPFLDEDVRPSEARVLLARVLRTLRAWAARSGVPLVLTHAPAEGVLGAGLAALVEGVATGRVELPARMSPRIEAFAGVA
jgi:hypothetical protein